MDHWVGTIREPDLALSWSSLEADDTTRTHWAVRETFVLVLDDGRAITVEPTSGALELSPEREERGRFEAFADRPEAKRFGDAAPAPHRRALLRTAEARAGDRVTVFGEVLERAFDGESAHREAASSRPAKVRASRVLLGDPPEPARGPRESSRPRRSVLGVVLLSCAALSAVTSVFAFRKAGETIPALAPDAASVALTLLALALILFRHVAHPLGFYVGKKPVDSRPPGRSLGFGVFMFMFLAVTALPFDDRTVDGSNVNNHDMVVIVCAVALVGCLGWLLVTGWNTARLSRLVLRAPLLGAGERDRWGRLVGKVDDPTPIVGEDAAMLVTRELEWDDSGEHEIETEADERGGFLLRTEDGETISVEAGESTWATDVRRFVHQGLFGPKPAKDQRALVSIELVPQGAAVVVAGRVRDGNPPRLKSSGPESLLLFATAPNGDVLAALRRAHFRWWASIGVVLVLGVGVAALHSGTVDSLPDGIIFLPGED